MKIASIDVGTNTILLLITEINLQNFTFTPLLNVHKIPRIGKNLFAGGNILPEKIQDLLDIMKEYQGLIKDYNCEAVVTSGTNALRIAANTGDIVQRVLCETGIKIEVITGETEAHYAFLGAGYDYQGIQYKTVIDIGGGSTEIIRGNGNSIETKKSYQIGVVSLSEMFAESDPPSELQISKMFEYSNQVLDDIAGSKADEIAIAIGGTPTTLYSISKGWNTFKKDEVEGASLGVKEIDYCVEIFKSNSIESILKQFSPIVKGREDLLLAGGIILKTILNRLNLSEIKVSTKGIRYGAVVDYVNRNFISANKKEV